MSRLLRSLRQVFGSKPVPSPSPSSVVQASRLRFARSIDTDFTTFREGDRALVFNAKKRQHSLTGPLQRGQKFDTPKGFLKHDDIIGRRPREQIATQKGFPYRIMLPTLDQYVAMTPRHVTPIYAKDANVIVSLLDIHVSPSNEDANGPAPLQILESGTGHGALTLHLSRAIQAASSLPPPIPNASQITHLDNDPSTPTKDTPTPVETDTSKQEQDEKAIAEAKEIEAAQQDWDTWRAQRKAIIHTVEVSPVFSKHAEKLVRGFRRGIYAGNVDFYVGRVETWISEQLKSKAAPEPFLTHAILDMPSAHLRIPHVAPILKPDAVLAVFMPSVTQIADCVEIIKKHRLEFDLERVIELGTGLSGGREWDVRIATKKSKADPGWIEQGADSGSGSADAADAAATTGTSDEVVGAEAVAKAAAAVAKEAEDVLICRPLAGQMIGGGGFVGVWKKMQVDN
ncbi:S-adenosyl-L-methionine-dependent methyltransferase [Aspergillus unguis]